MLVYDTLNEYEEGIICESKTTLCDIWSKVHGNNYKIVYRPINPLLDFDFICELVFACGDITFVVEEIDTFLSLSPAGLSHNFLNIVQRGRHRDIELIGITQRPYTMPAILRSQCKELYSFRKFEQRDIEWLRGIFGNRAEEIKTLEQYEYLSFVDNHIDKRKTVIVGKTLSNVPVQDKENPLPQGDKPDDEKNIL